MKLKSIMLALIIAIGAFAQAPTSALQTCFYGYGSLPSQLTGETEFGYDAPTVFTFDRAYILSLPPAVQALHVGEVGQLKTCSDGSQVPATNLDPATRMTLAMNLAKQGYFIDAWIDAFGADPYMTQSARIQEGVLTVQEAIGNAVKNVSIKVSDYPAYVPPIPPPVPTTTASNLVGAVQFGALYAVSSYGMSMYTAGLLVNGQSITEGGHTYVLTVTPLVVGSSILWKQIS